MNALFTQTLQGIGSYKLINLSDLLMDLIVYIISHGSQTLQGIGAYYLKFYERTLRKLIRELVICSQPWILRCIRQQSWVKSLMIY